LRFLRHIERNSILLFLIPADSNNHYNEYQILLNELRQFNPELIDKQRIVAISKSDLLDQALKDDISTEMKDIPHVFFSSIAETGIVELKDLIWNSINS
jgi:GTP-binding protein